MLTTDEKKTLNELLALAPEPENTFTYDELLGFLFGLAMTPNVVPPSEWQPIIFGGDSPTFDSTKRAQEMTGCLIQIHKRFSTNFHNNKLELPFDISTLQDTQVPTVFEWTSGFEEALALREEVWDPDEFPDLSDTQKEELFFSMMVIQGIVEPLEVMDFFDKVPGDVLAKVFPDNASKNMDQTIKIQIFLMASLPLTIQTLQQHARTVEKEKQKGMNRKSSPKGS